MSVEQLACLIVVAGPLLVGLAFAVFDLCDRWLLKEPVPSPARVARLAIGFVPTAALFVIAGIGEAAGTACLRLRDWMDV